MPTDVKVFRWLAATGGMPLNEASWKMFELPSPGVRYWHGGEGFMVRDVDISQDPPVVNLVFDSAWMDDVASRLPAGYAMEGGRSADSGLWHFGAVTAKNEELAPTWGDDLEDTLERAIDSASQHAQRAG